MTGLTPEVLAKIAALEKRQKADLELIAGSLLSYRASEIDIELLIQSALSTPSSPDQTADHETQSSVDEAHSLRINGALLTFLGFVNILAFNDNLPVTDSATARSKSMNHLSILLVLLATTIRISDLVSLNQKEEDEITVDE